jgi:hypothetical protein
MPTAHARPELGCALTAVVLVGAAILGALGGWAPARGEAPPALVVNMQPVPNASGESRTYSRLGDVRFTNPFFARLGTHGRSCATCHVPEDGWTLVPREVQQRFDATAGEDPLFRTVDASTSPRADVSTVEARRRAYSLLLRRGLLRIGLAVPSDAEFVVQAVDDPYAFASPRELSLFRRPLPATNLGFLTTVMWDGRETRPGSSMHEALLRQVNAAARTHLEVPADLPPSESNAVVALLTSLFTTQTRVTGAGTLPDGPADLAGEPFVAGINSRPFVPDVFTLFGTWRAASDPLFPARAAIGRGEALFNRRRFAGGLTCSTCHSSPNVGNSSTGEFFDIGVSAVRRRTADLPLYTLRCSTTGALVRTTDPGRALVTGRCTDIGMFKVPALRGLSTRAPYFHDGSAQTLEDVVDLYNARFGMGLTTNDRADLVMFLRAL